VRASSGGAAARVPSEVAPRYEVRARCHGAGDAEIAVWQLPSPASPAVAAPTRVAGLRGRNLGFVEHRVLRRLLRDGVRMADGVHGGARGHTVSEDLALHLGLLFRALAPMRSPDPMRAVADGIDAMGREEAAYWLGMALHRPNPRRVLTALRFLLTEPKAHS